MKKIQWVSWLCLALAGCDRKTDPPAPAVEAASIAWFDERAEEDNLAFRHDSGHRDRFLMPEIMSGGAALFDMDLDGDLDAYLVQGGLVQAAAKDRPPNQLFRNRGDGTFEDVTTGSGADDRGYGMGVATGDYDRDGDSDVYVTNVGPNVLLRNDGDGQFTDVTQTARVGDPGFSASATFVDHDLDGDLDLFVTNYLNWSVETELECRNLAVGQSDYCSPQHYDAPTADTLYRNNGDGTFTDISKEAGIADSLGTGLGVVAGDFTGDGYVDVFVANDGMMDRLWVNDTQGHFTDEALFLGCAVDENGTPKAGMGVTAGDYDEDGDIDLLVCNLRTESDSLYRNTGSGFMDDTAAAGLGVVSRMFTRFGMGWADFDNDGRFDLYQANGRVTQVECHQPNLLLRGTSSGRFEEVTPRGGTSEMLIHTSRAAAFGDIDNDGGVDVLVVNRDGPAYLLRNQVGHRGNWIIVQVLDLAGSDAVGATVTMTAGDRHIIREVRTGYSYLAANDPRVHVGLGEAVGVTNVAVRWPNGELERFGDLAAGEIHTLRRGAGE